MGYGDFKPETTSGRFVIFLCAIAGPLLISLMNISIESSIKFNSHE